MTQTQRACHIAGPSPEPDLKAQEVDTGPRGAGTPRAWTWAALMRRVFALDVLACPHCGGRLRLIATLHDPAVIRKLLAHLGMAPSGPSPGPAPPESGGAAPRIDQDGGMGVPG